MKPSNEFEFVVDSHCRFEVMCSVSSVFLFEIVGFDLLDCCLVVVVVGIVAVEDMVDSVVAVSVVVVVAAAVDILYYWNIIFV